MYIPTLSLEVTLILLWGRQSVFKDFSERAETIYYLSKND